MKLRTLSASAADCYESCPARYKAQYQGERVQEVASGAADIGTACHEALELFVQEMIHAGQPAGEPRLKELLEYFNTAYWKLFTDRERYDEGVAMLKTWHARMDWTGRTVLSTETKEFFPLPTSIGDVRVNYIYDRLDQHADGTVEVIDYKTVSQPIQPGELKHRIQPRLYALAAAIKFPDAPKIKVTLDLLRYDQVGTVFTRDDNVTTWKYLKHLAERIIADNTAKERVNADCRWCIRRDICASLRRHVAIGGPLSLDDPVAAVDLRRELVDQKSAIGKVLDDIDDYLIDWAREHDTLVLETDQTVMEIGARQTRGIDAERAAQVIGAEIVARHGSLTMTEVDRLLKGSELSDEQKMSLRALITRNYGSPSVKTKSKPAHERNP